MARLATSYRAARKADAKSKRIVWKAIRPTDLFRPDRQIRSAWDLHHCTIVKHLSPAERASWIR